MKFITINNHIQSKYINNSFSKPKFGKLYIFNCYGSGSIVEQNTEMETGKYYKY